MAEKTEKTIEISTGTILRTIIILVLVFFLYLVRDIVLLFLIAFTLASALEPLVSSARRRFRLPRGLTVFLVYIVVIGLIGLFFYALTPSFVEQFKELGMRYESFSESIEKGSGVFEEFLRRTGLASSLGTLFAGITGVSGGAFGTAVGFLTGLLEIISILVISFYLVIEQGAIRTAISQWVPDTYRDKTLNVVTTIQRKLGLWLLGQLILSLTIFLVTFIVLSILNVNLALALAALAGLLEIVPFLGPFIAAIPAILVAFTQSPTLALFVAVLYLLIQKAEGYVLVPKIMQKTVGVHPLVVLMAILVGFKLAGILGALLAVPVVAAGSVLFEAYVVGRMPQPPAPAEEVTLSDG